MKIGLLGSGSQADEVESYAVGSEIIFRAVSREYLKEDEATIDINEVPSDKLNLPVIAAVGTPALRKKLVSQWKGKKFSTLISDKAYVHKSSIIGEGSVVAPSSVITTNVKVGRHTIINIGATISHDCTVEDYVTISPGANIAGNVYIAEGVFIGIGSILSNGIKIASGSVIGAGAVVINDVNVKNSVVVGNPGKLIRTNKNWLNEI